MERRKVMRKLFVFALASVTSVTGILFGLPASSAAAAPSAASSVVVRGDFVPDASGRLGGTVQCPTGYRVIGIGAGTTGIGLAAISALAPTADLTGATLLTNIISPPHDSSRSAFLKVRCAPANQFTDVVVVQTNDHRIRPGTFSEGVSRCPAGYFGFGGGGYYTSGGGGVLGAAAINTTNAPSADGTAWTYAGVAPSTATTQVTIIQCAPRTGRDILVQFGPVSNSRGRSTHGVATCPSGYTPIAGGFYVSNTDGSVSTDGDMQESDQSADGGSWLAVGFIPIGTKMVALAQCLL